MGPRRGVLWARLRAGRTWLRERGPVTLAAALLLEVSSATPASGPVPRALLRALLLALLLFLVLVAATFDGLVSRLVDLARFGAASTNTWVRTVVLGERAPVPISPALLLDRPGRPLRGAPRASRIAAITRDQEREARARSVRGRAVVASARARSVTSPYVRRIAARLTALEARAIAARATAIAESRTTLDQVRPYVDRAITSVRRRGASIQAAVRVALARGAARVRSSATPGLVWLRVAPAARATQLSALGARALGVVRVGVAAVPVPRFPVPRLSLATVRVVTVGVLLSFVFATVIGTTGLVANRGTVALGASTSLAIISGEVTVQGPGADQFRVATDGEVLQAGMTVRTGVDTYAILTYFEGSTVSIDPATTLVIEQLHANPDGSTVIGMRQDVGRTWHAVTKLLTAGSKYEVRTPTATASVRGTLFLVGVLPSADLGLPETVIETTAGAVAAERAPTVEKPEGEEIIVPAGFTVTAKPAETIPPPVPAPEPERKVTVTVGSANSLVVDPQGRANGEKDGKLVVQTPGATVERVDGKVIVTLPNISDGKVSTVIQPTTQAADAPPAAPVEVVTVVQEKGKSDSRSTESVTPQGNAPGVTGVELKKSADPEKPADLRKLDETEKQQAPAPKVAEAPAPPAEPKQEQARAGDGGQARTEGDGEKKEGDQKKDDEDGKRASVVQSIVTLTLPPLSADELARREDEKRKSDDRAREERQRREAEERARDAKRIEELRAAEERAKANVTRIGGERQAAEVRREERREAEPTQAPPAGVVEQIFRAITPEADSTKRIENKNIDDLRKAEEKAREDATKAEEQRRKAEEKLRADSIKAEEEKKKEAEKRSQEFRKAEEKAKEDAPKKLEELRRIEEKAREQAAKLAEEQRKQAEKLIEDFRKAEEKAREQEAKRLEEQRKAEEKAREDAEKRLEQLRKEEEKARQDQEKARSDEAKRLEELRTAQENANKGGFVPTETLKPLPGVGSRAAEDGAVDKGVEVGTKGKD